MSLSNDYIFLRTIEKCLKKGNIDTSLLSCKEVLEKFRGLIKEVSRVGVNTAGLHSLMWSAFCILCLSLVNGIKARLRSLLKKKFFHLNMR